MKETKHKNRVTILKLTSCLVTLFMLLGSPTAAKDKAKNPNSKLVGELSKELNITPKQAMGGAGAIFQLVKMRLSPADFGKVAAAVPGMDGFLKAVPEGGGGSMVDSLLDSLGSTGTTEGGAQDLAGLASLAGSFQSLGLSPSMIPKFVPALERYIGMKGGSGLAGLFGSLFGGALK